jgi:hypothetical protein
MHCLIYHLRRPCRLYNPCPPTGLFQITTFIPQFTLTIIPPPRVSITRSLAPVSSFYIHISLNHRRDGTTFPDITLQCKLDAFATDIARSPSVEFGPAVGGAGVGPAACANAAGEVRPEEGAQGRGGGGGDADAWFDCRPDRHIHGGVEEIAQVSHSTDVWNPNNRCA